MILVTGATGHVGNTLVKMLAEQGESLRLFLQPQESIGSLDGIQFELVSGDIRNTADVDKAVAGCDYVYHLAGIVDIAPKHSALLFDVNVNGTRNVVEACLKHKVKRLVYVSSVHAIPEPPRGQALKEVDASCFPDRSLLGDYAVSKSEATAEIYKGISRGLDAVILFPSGIIGPNDYKGSEMGHVFTSLIKNRKKNVLFTFNGAYNFVDVRDVATALQMAMTNGRAGEGYIISGHALSIAQLFRYVFSWMGKATVRLLFFPVKLVKFAAGLVIRFCHLFNLKTFFTPYSIDVLESNAEMDHSKANKELGFSPRPLNETLDETLTWLAEYRRRLVNFSTNRKRRKDSRKQKRLAAKARRREAKLAARTATQRKNTAASTGEQSK